MCHIKRKNGVLVLMAISMIIMSLLMIIFPVMGMETVAIWILMEVVMIPVSESCMQRVNYNWSACTSIMRVVVMMITFMIVVIVFMPIYGSMHRRSVVFE